MTPEEHREVALNLQKHFSNPHSKDGEAICLRLEAILHSILSLGEIK